MGLISVMIDVYQVMVYSLMKTMYVDYNVQLNNYMQHMMKIHNNLDAQHAKLLEIIIGLV